MDNNLDLKHVFDSLSPAQKALVMDKLKHAENTVTDLNGLDPELDILRLDTTFTLKLPQDSVFPRAPYKAILLTGATGFVGSHVLYSFLKSTTAHLYCLVRGNSAEHARIRIITALKSRKLWNAEYQDRITVFCADLSQDNFGLELDQYRALSFLIDSIVHCGGIVNFAFSYTMLRGTALGSTQHLLRFATLNRLKKFNFISSYSALLSHGVTHHPFFSEGPLPDRPCDMRLGYIKSKWVSEKLLENASQQGVPVTIMRLGNVLADINTGLGNAKDLFTYIPEFCIKRKLFPDINFKLDLSPVNFVRDAVVTISQQGCLPYHVVNVVNPNPFDMTSLKTMMTSLGPVLTLPYEDWVKHFIEYLVESVPGYSFSDLFDQKKFSLKHLVFPAHIGFQTDALIEDCNLSGQQLEASLVVQSLFMSDKLTQKSIYSSDAGPLIQSILHLNTSKRPTILQSFIHKETAKAGTLMDGVARSLSQFKLDGPFKSFFCSSRYEAIDGLVKLCRHQQRGKDVFYCLDEDPNLAAFTHPLSSFNLSTKPGLHFFDSISHLMSTLDTSHKESCGVLITLYPDRPFTDVLPLVTQLQGYRIPVFIDISYLSIDTLPNVPFKFFGIVAGPMITHHRMPSAVFCVDRRTYQPWNSIDNCILHTSTYANNLLLTTSVCQAISAILPLPKGDSSHDITLTQFQRHINPKLALLLKAIGMANPVITAHESVLTLQTKRAKEVECIDALGSFGCSLRGHSPSDIPDLLVKFDEKTNYVSQLKTVLSRLSGLPNCLMSVSGASAVEKALSLALLAAPSKPYVIVFKGGFSGKTLFSLTGTAKEKYRHPFYPLYENVIILDPWTDSFTSQFDEILLRYPVGLVWFELIQGEAGIKPLPLSVIDHIKKRRDDAQYLIGVDEIQSGLFRTGTCFNYQKKSLSPDIVTIAKGLSDMTFPNAAVVVSDAVYHEAKKNNAHYVSLLDTHFNHQLGAYIALNALKKAQDLHLAQNATDMGHFILTSLKALEGRSLVRNVRGEGLMIGIELDDSRFPFNIPALKDYVSALFCGACMKLAPYPVLVAFTLNSGNIVRIEPALTITKDEALKIVNCISFIAKMSPLKIVSSVFR
jgi:thioester reductase-like protein